jgi:hypothetical protein
MNTDYMLRGAFGRVHASDRPAYHVGFGDGRRDHRLRFAPGEWETAWATYQALQERFGHHAAYIEAEYA